VSEGEQDLGDASLDEGCPLAFDVLPKLVTIVRQPRSVRTTSAISSRKMSGSRYHLGSSGSTSMNAGAKASRRRVIVTLVAPPMYR
jgi:hypothetical protein